MHYPYKIEQDEHGYLVTFIDIPEAITYGYTLEQARDLAADGIIQALSFYFEENQPIPLPSHRPELPSITIPASTWLKVLLLNEMLASPLTQAEIARNMGKKSQELTRIVNLHHTTKLDTLVSALYALGKNVEISLSDATT